MCGRVKVVFIPKPVRLVQRKRFPDLVGRADEKKKVILDLMPADWTSSRRLREFFERKSISSATIYRWLPRLVVAGLVEARENPRGVGLGGTRKYYRKAPHFSSAIAMSRKNRVISGAELDLMRKASGSSWSGWQKRAYLELSLMSDVLAARIIDAIFRQCRKAKSVEDILRSDDAIVDGIKETLRDLTAVCYRHRNLRPGGVPILDMIVEGFYDSADEDSARYLGKFCPQWANSYASFLPPDILARILILHPDSRNGLKEIRHYLKLVDGNRASTQPSSFKGNDISYGG